MKLRLPLALAAAVLATFSLTGLTVQAAGSISINFGTSGHNITSGSYGAVPVDGANWNNVNSNDRDVYKPVNDYVVGGSLKDSSGAGVGSGMTMKITGASMWGPGGSNSLTNSFIDDQASSGKRAGVALTGVPYLFSSVYVILSGDSGEYSAMTINGISYKGDGTKTVQGTGAWGNRGTNGGQLGEGVNYLVAGAIGSDISIAAGTAGRGTIAGVQVVDRSGELLVCNVADGATVEWTDNMSGWAIGDTGAAQNWSDTGTPAGVVAAWKACIIAGNSSALTISSGQTRVTSGFFLQSGNLTLGGGGTLQLNPELGSSAIQVVNASSTLTLSDIQLILTNGLSLYGKGKLAFSGTYAIEGVKTLAESRDFTIGIANSSSLTLNGAGTYAYGGKWTADGSTARLILDGDGTHTFSANGFSAFNGVLEHKKGTFSLDGSFLKGAGVDFSRTTLVSGSDISLSLSSDSDVGTGVTGFMVGSSAVWLNVAGWMSTQFSGTQNGSAGVSFNGSGMALAGTDIVNDWNIRVGQSGMTFNKAAGSSTTILGDFSQGGTGTRSIFSNGTGTVKFTGQWTFTDLLRMRPNAGTTIFANTAAFEDFWINQGATVKLEAGANISTRLFRMTSDGVGSSTYIQTGGLLRITGEVNDEAPGTTAFLLSHWATNEGKALFDLQGGQVIGEKAVAIFAHTGESTRNVTMSLSGNGEATFKGLNFKGDARSVIRLEMNGGRLNLGDYGIVHNAAANNKITLQGGAIVGAFADWRSTLGMEIGAGGAVFDTTDIKDTSLGRKITIQGAMTGTGSIKTLGKGVLDMSASSMAAFGGDLMAAGSSTLISGLGGNASRTLTLQDTGRIVWLGSDTGFTSVNAVAGSRLTIGFSGLTQTASSLDMSSLSAATLDFLTLSESLGDRTLTTKIINLSSPLDQISLYSTWSDAAAAATLSKGGDWTSGLFTYSLDTTGSILRSDVADANKITWQTASSGAAWAVTAAGLTEATYFSLLNDYLYVGSDGKTHTAVKVTGSGDTKVNLVGGSKVGTGGRNIDGNISMSVEGGSFASVSGGTLNIWGGGGNYDHTGNIYLQLIGTATADTLIGGSAATNGGKGIKGDIWLAVGDSAQVSGNIVGNSTTGNNDDPIHKGSTYVTINNIQTAGGLLIGGNAKTANTSGSINLEGNTSVTLNLNGLTGAFGKSVYGGGALLGVSGGTGTITGSTSVVINADNTVTFANNIVGGSVRSINSNGALNIGGNSSVTLNGGSFSGNIYAGSLKTTTDGTGVVNITGNTLLTLNGGDFKATSVLNGGSSNGGTVGGTAGILITGSTISFADGAKMYAAGGGNVTGNTSITFDGATSASFGGKTSVIDGGSSSAGNTVGGTKSLIFKGSKVSSDAVFQNFNAIDLTNSTVSLSGYGGASSVTIGAGSSLSAKGDASLATLTLGDASVFYVGGMNNIGSVTTSALSFGADSVWKMDLIGGLLSDTLIYTGTNNLVGNVKLDLVPGASFAVGDKFTLMISSADFGLGTFSLSEVFIASTRSTFTLGKESVDGKYNLTVSVTASSQGNLTWKADTGTWTVGEGKQWTLNNAPSGSNTFYQSDIVSFIDLAGQTSQNVSIKGEIIPESILINNTDTAYTFGSDATGGSISGAKTTLTKSGSGTLTINLGNTYGGGTTLEEGNLVLGHEKALGTGKLTVAGGRLTSSLMGVVLGGGLDFTAGEIRLNANTSLLIQGSYTKTGSGSFHFAGGKLNVAGIADETLNLGILSGIQEGSALDLGSKKVVLGVDNGVDSTLLTITSTGGAIQAGGVNILNLKNLNSSLYAGTAGLTLTGVSAANSTYGIYGGSWEAQTAPSGNIVIGSTDAGISTNLSFSNSHSNAGIFGAGANLGTPLTGTDKNASVLSTILAQGAVTGSILNQDGTVNADAVYNTTISGKIYGGAVSGSSLYGSSQITLNGIHFIGSNAEFISGGAGALVAGAALETTLYGNATLKISGSRIDSKVWGTIGTVNGDVLFDLDHSYFANDIVLGSSGGGGGIKGNVTLKDVGSTFAGSIYGGRDGTIDGKVTLNMTDSIVKGSIYGSASMGRVLGGVDMTLDNVSVAGMLGLTLGEKNVTGDSTITIGGASSINRFQGVGSRKGSLTGNLIVNINGGTLGAGQTGTNNGESAFTLTGRDAQLTGNATLNIAGGTIKNEHMLLSGFGGQGITGNVNMKVTGSGSIESNIYMAGDWGSRIGGNANILLDGGSLGLDGATRVLSGGSWGGFSYGDSTLPVAGAVSITLDGTLSQGVGTAFKGTYNIYAGAQHSKVGGNTLVTLSNISQLGGVADFGGVISGANSSGGGVGGTERKLVFDNYTTSSNAQFQYFTLAEVKGASAVELKGAATSISSWSISGNSSLTISNLASLGGASAMSLASAGDSFTLKEGAASGSLETAFSGLGSLIINGNSSSKLTLNGASSQFNGKVIINNGTLELAGGSFGGSTAFVVSGTLQTARTADLTFSQKLESGSVAAPGSFIVANTGNTVTKLTHTDTSSYKGTFSVVSGTLEMAAGVLYGGNSLSIGENGTVKLHNPLENSFGSISSTTLGTGKLILGVDSALTDSALLSAFSGIVALDANVNFTLAQTNNGWNAAAGFELNGHSTLTLHNAGTTAMAMTVSGITLRGEKNIVRFTGTEINLSVTSTQGLIGALNADVTFDIGASTASTIKLVDQISANVFDNIYLMDADGVAYQSLTDASGYLMKVSLDDMTELPKTGANSLNGSYKITAPNTADHILLMDTGADTTVSSLSIASRAGMNEGWNLNGTTATILSGSLLYQDDKDNPGADYLISGGTLKGSETKKTLTINQFSEKSTLTISATIADYAADNATLLKKIGAGTLSLTGLIQNTGGVEVTRGTLKLSGQATGNGKLSNSDRVELGNGVDAYTSAFSSVENKASGTLTVKQGATLDLGTLTNNGMLTFENTLAGRDLGTALIAGTGGTVKVTSGKLIVAQGQTQHMHVEADTWLDVKATAGGAIAILGGAVTGTGTVSLINQTGAELDCQNVTFGTDWSRFGGTMILDGAGQTMRVGMGRSGVVGSALTDGSRATIDVRSGAQYMDGGDATIARTANWILSGSGQGGFGALRIMDGATYSGDITIAAGGAGIGGSSGTVTLSGDISGGLLSLGSSDASNNWSTITTLTGDNRGLAGIKILHGTVNIESATALGGLLELASGDGFTSKANIKTGVSTGTLSGVAGSILDITNPAGGNSSLTLTGNAAAWGETGKEFAGTLTGNGTLTLNGDGQLTLSGTNTAFTGSLEILQGTLKAASAGAFGAAASTLTLKGGTVDLNSQAVTSGIKAIGSSLTLNNGSAYTGALTLGDGITQTDLTANGNLNAGNLNVNGKSSLNIAGNLTVTGGGSFYLDNSNHGLADAVVTAQNVTLDGTFTLNFNTNDFYDGQTTDADGNPVLVYNLVTAAAITGGANFSFANNLPAGSAYEKFFSYSTTLSNDFVTPGITQGKVTVTIKRNIVDAALKNMTDALDEPYYSQGQISYLGADETGTSAAPLHFTGDYNVSAGDDAYRLTNGKGWLKFDPANGIIDQHGRATDLIFNDYTDPADPGADLGTDRGVILSAGNNTFTGDTYAYQTRIISDAGNLATGGAVNTFSQGDIILLGQRASLELKGTDDQTYTYGNTITLTDSAALLQTSGTNTLNGRILIAAAGTGGTIRNEGSDTLTLAGGIAGGTAALQGDNNLGNGNETITLGAQNTLNILSVSQGLDLTLAGANSNLTVNRQLALEGGSSLTIGQDARLNLGGALVRTGTGATTLTIDGGILHTDRDITLSLNPSAGIRLAFTGDNNRVSAGRGATMTLADITTAATETLNKIGEGTTLLTGTLDQFLGTMQVTEGTLEIAADATGDGAVYGGNLIAGDGGNGNGKLIVANDTTLKGNMTVNKGSNVTMGNRTTLEGQLTVADGVKLTAGQESSLEGNIHVGSGSTLDLGKYTAIGRENGRTALNLDRGTVNFGYGSKLTGQLEGGLTIGDGSTYGGTLNAGTNNITFGSGSTFSISGDKTYFDTANDRAAGMLKTSGTITLNNNMTFSIADNFKKNNLEHYIKGVSLLKTTSGNAISLVSTADAKTRSGEKTIISREQLSENGDYSSLLGGHDYKWITFTLLGGERGQSLELKTQVAAHYDLLANTSNERAIAPVASDLANNFSHYEGNLRNLGIALATGTSAGSQGLLTGLSQSTSSTLSGYAVQKENLRRHALELRDRAVQEQPSAERYAYEQYQNTIWASGLGGTYKLNGDNNAVGNTSTVWGGTLGASTSISEHCIMGLAFSYTNTKTEVDNGLGSSTGDAYYLDLYTRYSKNDWNITGVITGGFTSLDTQRNMTVGDFGTRTKASADGSQIMALIEIGRQFRVSDDGRSLLEPFAIITGGYSSLDGLNETGAGTAGLTVDSASNTQCSLGAGLRFIREFQTGTNQLNRGRFEARAIIMQDLADTDVTVDAAFQGAKNQKFSQKGATPGDTALLIGTGVTLPVSIQAAVFADINGEFRAEQTGCQANLGVKIAF